MAINLVIGSEEETNNWTNDARNLRGLQQKACDKLLQLIKRQRPIVEPKCFRYPYRWNQV